VLDSYFPDAVRDPNDGVVGFEDLDVHVEVALGDDVDCKNWSGDANMADVQIREEVNESPGIQIASNLLKDDGRPVVSPVNSKYSQTRTPTTCFSVNGFSEEIIKDTNQVGALKANGGIEEPLINVDGHAAEGSHAKVLNVDALEDGECQGEQSDVNSGYPPGFEPHVSPSVEKSGETSIPSGFGETIKVKVSAVRKGCTLKKHIDYLEKR